MNERNDASALSRCMALTGHQQNLKRLAICSIMTAGILRLAIRDKRAW